MFITTDLEGFSFLFTFVSANNFIWYMIKKQKQIVAHVAPASSYILLRRKKKVGAKAGYSSYCNTDDSNYFTMFERKRKYLPDVFFSSFFLSGFRIRKLFWTLWNDDMDYSAHRILYLSMTGPPLWLFFFPLRPLLLYGLNIISCQHCKASTKRRWLSLHIVI